MEIHQFETNWTSLKWSWGWSSDKWWGEEGTHSTLPTSQAPSVITQPLHYPTSYSLARTTPAWMMSLTHRWTDKNIQEQTWIYKNRQEQTRTVKNNSSMADVPHIWLDRQLDHLYGNPKLLFFLWELALQNYWNHMMRCLFPIPCEIQWL